MLFWTGFRVKEKMEEDSEVKVQEKKSKRQQKKNLSKIALTTTQDAVKENGTNEDPTLETTSEGSAKKKKAKKMKIVEQPLFGFFKESESEKSTHLEDSNHKTENDGQI